MMAAPLVLAAVGALYLVLVAVILIGMVVRFVAQWGGAL